MASKKKAKISKVFIDSSVLIAAAISSRGSARDLIMKAIRGEVELSVSNFVLEETRRNIVKKAPNALSNFELFIYILNPEIVKAPKKLVVKTAESIEAKDAPVVAAAVHSNADFLVSFDKKHILNKSEEIKKKFNLKVTKPDKLTILILMKL